MENYIKTFSEFINENLNEADLSTELMKFGKGDVIITTKSFKLTDFDFKKSARTWWGSNISSILNIATNDSYNKNTIIPEDSILMIFTKPVTLKPGKEKIIYDGYIGGFLDGEWHISSREHQYDYNEITVQIAILALLDGFAEPTKYNKLSASKRNEIEVAIKKSRIIDAISSKKHNVIVDDMIVNSYETHDSRLILKGFDANTKRQTANMFLDNNDIMNKTFLVGNNIIDGDPFNNKF